MPVYNITPVSQTNTNLPVAKIYIQSRNIIAFCVCLPQSNSTIERAFGPLCVGALFWLDLITEF